MFKKLIILSVLAALALAACGAPAASRDEQAYYTDGSTASKGGGTTGEAAPEADVLQTVSLNAPMAADAIAPMVVKNASLSLVVKDPAASLTAITNLANSVNGFVVSSNSYQASVDAAGNKIMRGNIAIRVPVDQLEAVVAQLEALAVTGAAETKNVTGEDVTGHYTDLESQLTNLEAAEAQLQKIMDGATKTEDVLAVYNQLVSIRGQIEQVKGQMKYFRESAAMSYISVDLIPDALSQPLQVAGWKPQGVAKTALESLVRALQNIAEAVIWGGVYCLPLGLLFGLPAFFIGRWIWRKVRRPKAVKPA